MTWPDRSVGGSIFDRCCGRWLTLTTVEWPAVAAERSPAAEIAGAFQRGVAPGLRDAAVAIGAAYGVDTIVRSFFGAASLRMTCGGKTSNRGFEAAGCALGPIVPFRPMPVASTWGRPPGAPRTISIRSPNANLAGQMPSPQNCWRWSMLETRDTGWGSPTHNLTMLAGAAAI
jgi:hypothetical protein